MGKDNIKKVVKKSTLAKDDSKKKTKSIPAKKVQQEETEEIKKAQEQFAEEAEDLELEDEVEEEGEEEVVPESQQTNKKKQQKKEEQPNEFSSGASVIPINLKKKAAEAKRKHLDADAGDRRVIYISRLPNGFYEPQLKKFFSQFGRVIAVALGRNPKTGKSRHYAFVEFARQDVAEIAAAAMDRYILGGHRLQCTLANEEKTEVMRNIKKIPEVGDRSRQIEFSERTAASLEGKTYDVIVEKLKANQEKIKAQLDKAGVTYEFPPF